MPTVKEKTKFKPAPKYNPADVKDVLLEKIAEEMKLVDIQNETYDEADLHYRTDKVNIVSLFSGAGGLDLGIELAGLDCILGEKAINAAYKDKQSYFKVREKGIFNHLYANDFFKEALETYKGNFPRQVLAHNCDIKRVKEFPKGEIVLGGFPCPGFSEAGPRLIDDPRNFLYVHFIRCLLQTQPKLFIAENVKGMLTLGKGEVFRQIKQDFEAAGYRVYHKLLNARDYGVPQNRERVFLVGVRTDLDYEYVFPEPTHGEGIFYNPHITLEDAIGDLQSNPGDYFTGSYSTIFMSRNRKKKWSDQSFTIQASGRQAPIHPGGLPMEKMDKNKWVFVEGEENNRRLSIKEISRIQTFPDWYEFNTGITSISKNGQIDKAYRQIGNAVPVKLARAVARPIAEWLNKKER